MHKYFNSKSISNILADMQNHSTGKSITSFWHSIPFNRTKFQINISNRKDHIRRRKKTILKKKDQNPLELLKRTISITCEPHYGNEDNSSHSKSALCTQRLGNPVADTFGRDLQANLWLQVLERCRVCYHPAKIIYTFQKKKNKDIVSNLDNLVRESEHI